VDGESRALTSFIAGRTCYIADMAKQVRPSDLPTKRVTASDGTVVRMKVVQADSPTLGQDLLAAFRSNVRRIKTEQRRQRHGSTDAAQA
jgi:hypothetical protein